MALRIIIDGYNLIRQSPLLRSYDALDPRQGREKLLAKLSHYRMIKGNPMVVVFDGWREGNLTEHHTREKGIDIIYSKQGDTADEVIKRLVTHAREELIVVTSDREITHFCHSKRCEVIPSSLFEERMELSAMHRSRGASEEEEEKTVIFSPKKKGPSKKLPKAKRRFLNRLKKL